jgi:large subunit ribosomal protein L3
MPAASGRPLLATGLVALSVIALGHGLGFVAAPIGNTPVVGAAAPGVSQLRGASVAAESSLSSSAAFAAAALVAAGLAGLSRKVSVARRANLVATTPDQAIPWWNRITKPKTESGIGIWAEKLNMTTYIDENDPTAKWIPATILVVKRGGNIVTDKKWPEKHGYYALQVGYDRYVPGEWETGSKSGIKLAALEKNGIPPLKKLKEFRVRPQDWEKWEIGQKVWPSDIFQEGDMVDVHGRSISKGFAGHIKRWGHKKGPMGHGSKFHRRNGSVSSGLVRLIPGMHRAGWLGDNNHTQQNLKILKIMDRLDEDNMPETIIVVEGSVPGYTARTENGGSYVYLHKHLNRSDGRFKRDPVWLWYTKKGEGVDPYVPLKGQAWTWKTFWGRDLRWITSEVKQYWPDGFPGYDHVVDPFYDGCDQEKALKAPEW